MRLEVLRLENAVLSYDTDDVEEVEEAGTPRDVIDVTPVDATWAHWKLGAAHLTLRLKFKPGTGPTWAPTETDKEV